MIGKDYAITLEKVLNGFTVEVAIRKHDPDYGAVRLAELMVFRNREELCAFIMEHFSPPEIPQT